MNVVDTMMSGRIDAVTLGSVAVGASAWSSIALFTTGVLMVVHGVIGHLDGADRRSEMADTLLQALWVALGLAVAGGLFLWCFEPILRLVDVEAELVAPSVAYLRALSFGVPAMALYLALRFFCEGIGESRPTLVFGLVGLGANVVANGVLMFGWLGGPRLGALGCGLATTVVWWLQLAAMVAYLRISRRHGDLGVLRRLGAPRLGQVREMLRIGLPIGGAIFLEASMFSIAALLVGSLGTTAMAGHQVALSFAALTFMLPLGISMAMTVRVGRADGRRDRVGVRRVALAGALLILACQTVSASLMLLVPRTIASIYTAEESVIALAVHLLGFAALFQLSDGLQVGAAGSLRGLRDTRVPMAMTFVAYWGCGLPTGYWLGIVRGWGAGGLWIGMTIGLTVAGILLGVRFLRLTRAGSKRFAESYSGV